MKTKLSLLILALVGYSTTLLAAHIDTIAVFSAAMNRSIPTLIVTPDNSSTIKPRPTLYLLHGYSGDEYSWCNITNIKELADRYKMIVVCPDGENSWYWDSPKQPQSQFETFVSKELVAHIDNHYPTKPNRKARAITGLSMGGHGAMWIAIRHSKTFGCAGSTSGGLDIRPFPTSWQMSEQIGTMANNLERWNNHTVVNQLQRLKNHELEIIIDCGTEDFFIEVNRRAHNILLEQKIDHTYIEREGAHNADYWSNSIQYQALFFSRYFNKKK